MSCFLKIIMKCLIQYETTEQKQLHLYSSWFCAELLKYWKYPWLFYSSWLKIQTMPQLTNHFFRGVFWGGGFFFLYLHFFSPHYEKYKKKAIKKQLSTFFCVSENVIFAVTPSLNLSGTASFGNNSLLVPRPSCLRRWKLFMMPYHCLTATEYISSI